MSVTLTTGKYNVSASMELADSVDNIGRGIEEYIDAAALRASDERWIREVITGISESLRESVKRREMPSADIPIPESVYERAWGQSDREKLKAEYRAKYRDYRPWVFYQASFLRDCQRLLANSAGTADYPVLQARRQIVAFAAVLSNLLGGTNFNYDSE